MYGTGNTVANNSIAAYNDMPNAPSLFYDRAMLIAGTAKLPVTYRAPGAVPEPATWSLFIAGFGVVGFGKRRQRYLAA